MTGNLLYFISNHDGLAAGYALSRSVQELDRQKYRIVFMSSSLASYEFQLYQKSASLRLRAHSGPLRSERPLSLPGLSDLLRRLEATDKGLRQDVGLLFSFLKRAGGGCLYLPPLARAETPLHFNSAVWQRFFLSMTSDMSQESEPSLFFLHIDHLYAAFLLKSMPSRACCLAGLRNF